MTIRIALAGDTMLRAVLQRNTVHYLAQAGIRAVGAGADQEHARAPVRIQAGRR